MTVIEDVELSDTIVKLHRYEEVLARLTENTKATFEEYTKALNITFDYSVPTVVEDALNAALPTWFMDKHGDRAIVPTFRKFYRDDWTSPLDVIALSSNAAGMLPVLWPKFVKDRADWESVLDDDDLLLSAMAYGYPYGMLLG